MQLIVEKLLPGVENESRTKSTANLEVLTWFHFQEERKQNDCIGRREVIVRDSEPLESILAPTRAMFCQTVKKRQLVLFAKIDFWQLAPFLVKNSLTIA